MTTRERWCRHHPTGWRLSIDAGFTNRTQSREDQRWSWREVLRIMYLSKVWWQCWNGKPSTAKGSSHYPPFKEAYGDWRNSNTGSVFSSTALRSWKAATAKTVRCLASIFTYQCGYFIVRQALVHRAPHKYVPVALHDIHYIVFAIWPLRDTQGNDVCTTVWDIICFGCIWQTT